MTYTPEQDAALDRLAQIFASEARRRVDEHLAHVDRKIANDPECFLCSKLSAANA
jgi:hypothetical protein